MSSNERIRIGIGVSKKKDVWGESLAQSGAGRLAVQAAGRCAAERDGVGVT